MGCFMKELKSKCCGKGVGFIKRMHIEEDEAASAIAKEEVHKIDFQAFEGVFPYAVAQIFDRFREVEHNMEYFKDKKDNDGYYRDRKDDSGYYKDEKDDRGNYRDRDIKDDPGNYRDVKEEPDYYMDHKEEEEFKGEST